RPRLDVLHRRLVEGHLATLDEIAAERAERMAVLVGVADAQALAVGETDLPRALDLQEEELHRVVRPGDDRRGKFRVARLDLGARPVRHEAAPFEPAAQ